MVTKYPRNTPNIIDKKQTRSQLDRNVNDAGQWKLESEMDTPGPVSFDSVTGAGGVVQISVSQLNDDIVDGWEMCHAASGVTSPTGLAYTYETGGKFLIPAGSIRNVWVRPVIGLKKGNWQGYGEIPPGEEIFTSMFEDADFSGHTAWEEYANMTMIFGASLKYNAYAASLVHNTGYGFSGKSVSLFNQLHPARHSAMGGRFAATLWIGYGGEETAGGGFVFLARQNLLSDPNDDFYVLALEQPSPPVYQGGQYQYLFTLYRVSGQVFTKIDSSSYVNSFGTYLGNNQEGISGVLSLPCIIDRNGSVFTVRNAADTATIWTITDTNIMPSDDRCYVGTYGYKGNQLIKPTLAIYKRNYAGELSPINPGSFTDYLNEANLTAPVNLSHYLRIASGNTGNDSVRLRWDDNLQLVADRDRPAGTCQETVVLNPKFKVGTITRDAAADTGTVATTGVGFKPRAIQFFWVLDGTAISGMAVYDGSTLSGTSFSSSWAQVSAVDVYTSGTNRQYATVSATGSDGFTLSWTKVDSPTGTIKITYFAFQ